MNRICFCQVQMTSGFDKTNPDVCFGLQIGHYGTTSFVGGPATDKLESAMWMVVMGAEKMELESSGFLNIYFLNVSFFRETELLKSWYCHALSPFYQGPCRFKMCECRCSHLWCGCTCHTTPRSVMAAVYVATAENLS